MFDICLLKAKIKLKMPLTAKEYAFAVLYLNLNPKAYSFRNDKNQLNITKTEIPENKSGIQQEIDLSEIDKPNKN